MTTLEERDRLAERLNRDCHCLSVDEVQLRSALAADLGEAGLGDQLRYGLLDDRPNLFALSPVFLSRQHLDQMAAIVAAVEAVVRSAPYREQVLAAAPQVARRDPGTCGVFLGYDFHITEHGPKLIEINTNAGGGLLQLYLAHAQRACCQEVADLFGGQLDVSSLAGLQRVLVEMFRSEQKRQHPGAVLQRVAIVDSDPEHQFLYPELKLFAGLFERSGIAATISDLRALAATPAGLLANGEHVDLVYNRSTDFYFASEDAAALREAYTADRVVVTPGPHHHALYANKRNLAVLSDPEQLAAWGHERVVVDALVAGIPRVVPVDAKNAESLWAERRQWFFKPAAGYGSRGAYRGAKLTRRVWEEIQRGDYVAQLLIAPSERVLLVQGSERALKLDVRCFVYAGEIQFTGARLYQGQTTNLRTEGGGLATVFTPPP